MTTKERLERLEQTVLALCEAAVDNDHAWGKWADPLHEFIKEMKEEAKDEEE
jgi:hypothetical protein